MRINIGIRFLAVLAFSAVLVLSSCVATGGGGQGGGEPGNQQESAAHTSQQAESEAAAALAAHPWMQADAVALREEQGFVVLRDGDLYADGQLFRFFSVNIPNYHILEDARGAGGSRGAVGTDVSSKGLGTELDPEVATGPASGTELASEVATEPARGTELALELASDKPWHRVTGFEQRDAAQAVQRLGGRVIRTYVPSVEGGVNNSPELSHIYLTEEGGIGYNEELFQDLDRGIAIAEEHGLRMIIPLVDNWEWFGGYAQWAALAGADSFWTDSRAISAFQDFITWLLNRRNTATGRLYRDEPAILAWELGNEIDKAPGQWLTEMAAFIRSQDDNHLIMDGGHKYTPAAALADPNIQILTTHYTDSQITFLAQAARRAGKAYIYGEYRPDSPARVAQIGRTVENSGATGALIWSLRFRSESGGFYFHNDFGDLSDSLHYPGFSQTRPVNEDELFREIREWAFQLQGINPPPPEPVPPVPELLPVVRGPKGYELTWRGSAGAQDYTIERASFADGPWFSIAQGVSDAVNQPSPKGIIARLPLYTDEADGPGPFWYRVRARNAAGVSEASVPVPAKAD